MKAIEVETAVADWFGSRQNLIVPNVSWGMFDYELDMLVITPSGYGIEVEIKVSASDLKADQKKRHGHHNPKIKELYFAVPHSLLKYENLVPAHAGILVVEELTYPDSNVRPVKEFRKPQQQNKYKFSDSDKYQIARLGTMRIWTLKQSLEKLARPPASVDSRGAAEEKAKE